MKQYNPTREIELAVRTGFLSKTIWNEFFAPKEKRWRNKLWAYFSARNLFFPHYSNRAQDVLVPNPKHPMVIKIAGDSIVMPPRVGVLDHDEIVTRSFLLLKDKNLFGSAKFESELKREDLRYRSHFDPADTTKYPDLLITLKASEPNKKIALELEISRKSPKRYRQMMNSYMTAKEVSAIIFITNLETIKNGIKSAIHETYFPEWEKSVGFVNLSDWKNDPLNARILFSDKMQSLMQMKSI